MELECITTQKRFQHKHIIPSCTKNKIKLYLLIMLLIILLQIFHIKCIEVESSNNTPFSEIKNSIKSKKLNIAIIGSGIGGLSSAYFLKKSKNLEINRIDIYERNRRVGGRIHSEVIFNRTENLGASFIIKENKLIYNLIQELNLKLYSYSNSGDNSFGLFNNSTIFFSMGNGKYINIAVMLWRYGFSIIREKILMQKNLDKFAKIYEALNSKITFKSVHELIKYMDLEELVESSIKEYLIKNNIQEKYIDEFVDLLIKIIYNQQSDINAFAGFVTLIGGSSESFKIQGGNHLIVQNLAEKLTEENNPNFPNKANIFIKKNYQVLKIEKMLNRTSPYINKSNDYFEITYKINNDKSGTSKDEQLEIIEDVQKQEYDAVIIASPWQNSEVQLPNEVNKTNLNLTPFENFYYFIQGHFKQKLFDNYDEKDLPALLVSYNITDSHDVLYIKKLNSGNNKPEYKINSNKKLTDDVLEIFFEKGFTLKYSNHWEMAYPKLFPRNLESLPSFQLLEDLYYLNAIESAASCIELSMISAKNIVNMIESKHSSLDNSMEIKNKTNESPEL